MSLVLNGDTGVQGNSGAFVAGTAVASTSGTSIDFTSIPSWVKRITVMFDGVSTNGTSQVQVQLGDSGGVENTGYLSAASVFRDNQAVISVNSTTGFPIQIVTAAYVLHGVITIALLNSSTNTWACSYSLGNSSVAATLTGGGSKSTSATLDRIRITTVNGTDTFDAGSINILYE